MISEEVTICRDLYRHFVVLSVILSCFDGFAWDLFNMGERRIML